MFLLRCCAGILTILALTQCSTFQGPGPNYSLTGAAAQTEIARFSLSEGFFHQGAAHMEMGPAETPYHLRSLRPLIRDVSPAADAHVSTSRVWNRVAWVSAVAVLGIFIAELFDGDDGWSEDQSLAQWSLLGVSFGASIGRNIFMDRAAEQYNHDLRAKFAPSVSWNFRF